MLFKNILTQSFKLVNTCSIYLKASSSLVTTQFKINHSNVKLFSASAPRRDLMEFFEDKENLKEEKIKHGRAWSVEELRLKNNVDLHKLWYVLHKERNMLLTMEQYYKKEVEPFPSPERIAKVDESMENLLAVVDERNVAYNLLETGETKKIEPYRRYNSFGFIQRYRPREYLVPWWLNKMWKLKYHYKKLPFWSKFYRTLLRVKLRQEKRKTLRRINYEKKHLFAKFPHLEQESNYVQSVLEEKYGYKPALKYHELVRKPLPNELPKQMRERINKRKTSNLEDMF